MMSRTTPKVDPKNTKSNQLPVRQIVQKAPSDDSDNYSDDFEKEDVEKEIAAKPNLNFTKKATPKVEEPKKTVPTIQTKKQAPPVEDDDDDDEYGSEEFASPSDYKSPSYASPAYIEEEPVQAKQPQDTRSFIEDKKPEFIYVDQETKDLQRERINYLKDYVGLEFESFDNLLEIQPSSEYSLYVSRIQNGILANSGDQTNDERATREVQTEDEFQTDFGIQWPEDKNRNVFSSVAARDIFAREEPPARDDEFEDTNKMIEFVKNAYPVIDEILTYQSKNITSKDKMMNVVPVEESLEVPEELFSIFDDIKLLSSFEGSRNQIFASYKITFSINGRAFPMGLIIEYLNQSASRYFIALSEVVCLYISINFRHALIGGTKDGSLLLWDLRDSNLLHAKNVHEIVNKIKEKEAGRFGEKFIYRFCNYSTDYLGENGHNSSIIKIKDTYSSKNVYEVFSLDEFGKVINWNIAILNKSDVNQTFSDPGMNFDSKVKLVKIAQFEINENYSRLNEALLCSDFDIDKQGTNLFICNQKGLAKIETAGQTKPPKTYENTDSNHGPLSVAVSASEYLYMANRDGTIEILTKNYSKPLATIGPFTKNPLTHILIPKYYPITLRNPSKYLEQLTKPIVFDKEGNIYFFSLDQDFQPSHVENPIKSRVNNQPFKLLHIWFESNLDMHMLYLVNKTQLLHLNLNCGKLLDVTHEPIIQKQKRIPLLFKVS